MNEHSQNPRPRGRPRTGDKRREILDAALSAFAERGYHGVSVPEVASAAGVGTGTVYRYFADKQDLVNHVFRDAKGKLRDAIFDGLDLTDARSSRLLFLDLWARLVRFARMQPLAWQFLEMQDHTPYLDDNSCRLELGVLMPLWMAGQQMVSRGDARDLPIDVMMAMAWGALVGILKSERLGYLRADDATLLRAGEACFAMLRRESEPDTLE